MKNLKRILLVEKDPKDIELIPAALVERNLANEVAVAPGWDIAWNRRLLVCRFYYIVAIINNSEVRFRHADGSYRLNSMPPERPSRDASAICP